MSCGRVVEYGVFGLSWGRDRCRCRFVLQDYYLSVSVSVSWPTCRVARRVGTVVVVCTFVDLFAGRGVLDREASSVTELFGRSGLYTPSRWRPGSFRSGSGIGDGRELAAGRHTGTPMLLPLYLLSVWAREGGRSTGGESFLLLGVLQGMIICNVSSK